MAESEYTLCGMIKTCRLAMLIWTSSVDPVLSIIKFFKCNDNASFLEDFNSMKIKTKCLNVNICNM